MKEQELDAFAMHVEDEYEEKIDKRVVLTERDQLACEINDANIKSAASARERSESRCDRIIMAAVDAGVRVAVQGAMKGIADFVLGRILKTPETPKGPEVLKGDVLGLCDLGCMGFGNALCKAALAA
jgi:hypothetical protein